MDLFNGMEFINGDAIKMIRSLKRLKQTAAAKKADVCQQYISKLELSNEVPVATFIKIATDLNCSKAEVEKIISLYPPPPIKINYFQWIFNKLAA
jgi:transcriptional regulator with XRE-family HTH domain